MIAVIGDIHGDFNNLQKLHQKIILEYPDIQIYCVGDLIDRGPDSKKVVQYCMDNKFIVIKGNHELMMLDFIDSYLNLKTLSLQEANLSHFVFGGKDCMRSYLNEFSYNRLGEYTSEMKYYNHIEYLKNLPWNLTVGKYYISHSGYWPKLSPEYGCFSQGEPDKHPDLFQIFGHQPQKDVLITDYYCNVDTGSFYSNKLSAIVLDENKSITEFHKIFTSDD